jgi:hypothetical protein
VRSTMVVADLQPERLEQDGGRSAILAGFDEGARTANVVARSGRLLAVLARLRETDLADRLAKVRVRRRWAGAVPHHVIGEGRPHCPGGLASRAMAPERTG